MDQIAGYLFRIPAIFYNDCQASLKPSAVTFGLGLSVLLLFQGRIFYVHLRLGAPRNADGQRSV
jgi:hypothetical protein